MAGIAHKNIAGVLLDIEGTTSSIAFVYEVMFPYARSHLRSFLQSRFDRPDVQEACSQIAADAKAGCYSDWLGKLERQEQVNRLSDHLLELMDRDVKTTGLKAIQGLVWEDGFRSGQLVAHLYPDVEPALRQWKKAGLDLRIYSSGSIHAQKLFFGHTEYGNLLPLLSGHYDTTIGSKREANSYRKIADFFHQPPDQILFISDVFAELEAAAQAGLAVVASCRPGNATLPADCPFRQIGSFAQIDLVK